MKQQIDNLIANLLLDEGELYLPDVGTLILRRKPAKLLSKRLLQSPYRELQYTKERRGVALTEYISRIAEVSSERSNDIYNEWLSQSLRNGVLTINELCTIEGSRVTTDKTFEDMANPNGRGTVKINPRTNYFIYIVAGLCMGFALGIAGYVLYTNGLLGSLIVRRGIAPASQAFECVAEEVVETSAVPQAEVVEAIEIVEAPAIEEATTPTEPTIQPMQGGKSYAVWGVYNELENAEKAIEWLAARIPEMDAHIYDYDGRYMVALCEVASRSECGRKVSAWKAEHISCKSVWVYTR